jgi:hypothetical protein
MYAAKKKHTSAYYLRHERTPKPGTTASELG